MRFDVCCLFFFFKCLVLSCGYFQVNFLDSVWSIYENVDTRGHVSGISGDAGVVHLGPSAETCRVR